MIRLLAFGLTIAQLICLYFDDITLSQTFGILALPMHIAAFVNSRSRSKDAGQK